MLIRDKIGQKEAVICDIFDLHIDDLKQYSLLIFGISTWGIGKMQEDWYNFLPLLKNIDFTGKKVALFGLGDQESYPDTFADALGILYDKLQQFGCSFTGEWPVEGYKYIHSAAERQGKFVGLVLDEKNQPELTDERITIWLNSINF